MCLDNECLNTRFLITSLIGKVTDSLSKDKLFSKSLMFFERGKLSVTSITAI